MSKVKVYAQILRNEKHVIDVSASEDGKLDHMAAELIRNTHSIEKGLSIREPRLGFGHAKQKEMMEQIRSLYGSGNAFRHEASLMGLGALLQYIEYHKAHQYTDDVCQEIEAFLQGYPLDEAHKAGGTLRLSKAALAFDTEKIEEFFRSRHSIRDFDGSPVDDETLKKALSLAQTAPSACNRQGVRAYVLSHENSVELAKQLDGVGGFAKAVDRFVMITGKTTAYRLNEINQYIVSPSIYAAYLTLTLHLYGLGACVIQRPVVWSSVWKELQKKFDIDEDEQIVCLLAVGNLKENCSVPISHRISTDAMIRFLD